MSGGFRKGGGFFGNPRLWPPRAAGDGSSTPARRPSAPWGPGGRAAQAPGAPVRRNCCAPAVRMLTGAFSGYNRFARARTPIIGQSTRKHSDCCSTTTYIGSDCGRRWSRSRSAACAVGSRRRASRRTKLGRGRTGLSRRAVLEQDRFRRDHLVVGGVAAAGLVVASYINECSLGSLIQERDGSPATETFS